MEEHAWETCKENVQPIKRGRSARGLGESLAPKNLAEVGSTADPLVAQEREMEARVVAAAAASLASGGPPRELLDAYALYFKWTRDAFPSSSDKAQLVLERATAALKDSSEVKNDTRFVKMWVEYADMVRTPGEVFSFMQSNKIGERIALFWIAWAFVAEKAENFKLTDQIFQKGLQRVGTVREKERESTDADKLIARARAEKDLLTKRYQQFQRRLARHFINSAEDGAVPPPVTSTGTERVALGGLAGTGAVALRTGSSRQQVSSENGPLAQTAASRTSRPSASAGSRIPGLSSSSSSALAPAAAAASASKHNFQIFSDDAPSSSSEPVVASQLAENSSWRELAPQRAARKENEGKAMRWTEGGLGLPGAGSGASVGASASLATVAPPAVHIPIFCDPEETTEADEEAATAPAPAPATSTFRLDMERSRAAPLAISSRETTGSYVDPLQRHKQQPQPSSAPTPRAVVVPPPAAVSRAATAAAPSSSSAAPPKAKAAPSSSTFEVYSDLPPRPAAATVRTGPVAAAAPAFEIFSDSPIRAPVPASLPAPASLLQQTLRDEAAEMAAMDALMDEMGLGLADADAEDGTINTRLARQHIDALFFSPGQDDQCGLGMGGGRGCVSTSMDGAISSRSHAPPDSGPRLFSHFNTTADLSAIKESSQEHSRFAVYTPNAGGHRPF